PQVNQRAGVTEQLQIARLGLQTSRVRRHLVDRGAGLRYVRVQVLQQARLFGRDELERLAGWLEGPALIVHQIETGKGQQILAQILDLKAYFHEAAAGGLVFDELVGTFQRVSEIG